MRYNERHLEDKPSTRGLLLLSLYFSKSLLKGKSKHLLQFCTTTTTICHESASFVEPICRVCIHYVIMTPYLLILLSRSVILSSTQLCCVGFPIFFYSSPFFLFKHLTSRDKNVQEEKVDKMKSLYNHILLKKCCNENVSR
jgi:hypothetical protein